MNKERREFIEGFITAVLLLGSAQLEEDDASEDRQSYGAPQIQSYGARPLATPRFLNEEQYLTIPTYMRRGKSISA